MSGVMRLFVYAVIASAAIVYGENSLSPLPATPSTPPLLSPSTSDTSLAVFSIKDLNVSPEYVTLYQKLENAASNGLGDWKNIKVSTFKADEMTIVLTRLIIEITTTNRTSYLDKYKSFGFKLPRDFDLYGFIEANPADSPKEWSQVLQNTMNALSPEDDTYLDGRLLWEAINSYHELNKMDSMTSDPSTLDMELYDAYVYSFFGASTELAWGTNWAFVDCISVTELVGKYRSKYWFTNAIFTGHRELSYDSTLLTELALLKHVDAEVLSSAPGFEVGNSVVEYYFPYIDELLQASAVDELEMLFAELDFGSYVEIASTYCQPTAVIRFCLIPHIYEQSKLLHSVGQDALDADVASRIPEQAVNLNRQKYLETISNRLRSQIISSQLMTDFDDLIDLVNSYAKNISLRAQDGSYEKAYYLQYPLKEQLNTTAQNEMESAGADLEGINYTIALQIKNLQYKISNLFDSFPAYEAALTRLTKHAENAQMAKTVNGLANFLAKALNALNPITWLTNPSSVGDVFSAANDIRKAATGIQELKNLIDILNNQLIPWLLKTSARLKEIEPQLNRVIETLKPLMSADGVNIDAIKKYGADFIQAYSQFYNPVSQAEVLSIIIVFPAVTSEFCRIAGGRATQDCDMARTQGNTLFDNLRQAVDYGEQAMDNFVDLAQAAVRVKSAEQFQLSLDTAIESAIDSYDKLLAKWNEQSEDSIAAFSLYQKRLAFGRSVATYRYLATTIQSNAAGVSVCNVLGYLNGGVPVAPCEGVYSNIATPVDANKLIAFQFNTKPTESKIWAYLPTIPRYINDTAYLSLDRLMNGENVTFQLPMDQDWLVENKWVTAAYDIKNTVAYVKKLQIFLPPREAAGGGIRTIDLNIKASKWSPLGPAMNHKQYMIPRRSFSFRYQALRDMDACSNELMNPYYTCGDERKLCELSSGEVDTDDETPLPSLFSSFDVSVEFSGSDDSKFDYTGVEKSLPLVVAVDLLTFKVDGKSIATHAPETTNPDSTSGSRRLRATVMNEELETCCENNSYVTQWKPSGQKPVCSACPKGHVSQFGGLFCVPASSQE